MNVEFHTSPLDAAFVHESKEKEGIKYIYRMTILYMIVFHLFYNTRQWLQVRKSSNY